MQMAKCEYGLGQYNIVNAGHSANEFVEILVNALS